MNPIAKYAEVERNKETRWLKQRPAYIVFIPTDESCSKHSWNDQNAYVHSDCEGISFFSTINILMLRLISIPRKDGQVKWKWFTDLGNSCPGNRFRLRMNYVDGAESPDAWNSCVNRTRWSRYPYGCNDVLGSTTYPLRVANVFDRMSSVWCAHPRWTCCSRWNQPIALKKNQ